jgi:hypothetical protein
MIKAAVIKLFKMIINGLYTHINDILFLPETHPKADPFDEPTKY